MLAAHHLAFIVLAAGHVALLLAGLALLTIEIAVILVEVLEVMVVPLLPAVTHASGAIIRNNRLAAFAVQLLSFVIWITMKLDNSLS